MISSVSLWMGSCLLLGAEFLYRQFHWCLVGLYLFFPLVTFLCSVEVASLFPYILLVCTYCVLRWTANEDHHFFPGDMLLYVGEKKSAAEVYVEPIDADMIREIDKEDEVNTWIVAVLVEDPRSDCHYRCIVKQTVLNRLCYERRGLEYIKEYYYLKFVGWYNQKYEFDRGNNVQELKIFGYPCKESAINVALHVTKSRLFTYLMCMLKYRKRAFFWYFFFFCSVVLYHRCDQRPAVTDLEYLQSMIPITVIFINEIAMIEIMMLQIGERYSFTKSIHNFLSTMAEDFKRIACIVCECCVTSVRNSVDTMTRVMENYIYPLCYIFFHDYVLPILWIPLGGFVAICYLIYIIIRYIVSNVYFFILTLTSHIYLIMCNPYFLCLMFGTVIGIGIMKLYHTEGPHHKINLSKEPEAAGTEVVQTVVFQIANAKIFENNHMHNYVRRIARVESKDGLNKETYREDYHGGVWQVDEPLFLVTQNTSYKIVIGKHTLIKIQFGIDWMALQWKDLRIPLWSGLAVYLYVCTIDEEIPSSISKQADHWNRNYNNKKEHPRKPKEFVTEVKELEANTSVCYKDVDLFIILDSSSSIKEGPYRIAKKFVADLVSGFTIGENNVHVGLVIYGSTARIEFDLDDSFDQSVIQNRIRNIPYLNSATATGDAIKRVVNIGFTETRGARSPNLAIPRVAIVITDGESNSGVDVHTAAQAARDKSIELFAFGIGNEINDSQLLEIAGSHDRIFKIDSYANIDDARALIAQGSCKVGIKATTSTRYKDNLDSGQNRLFEYKVPTEGITVQIQVTEGRIVMYGSHNNPDPSPVWHDYMLPSIHGDREIFISYPTAEAGKKEDEPTVPFYCNLVAIENSVFSIKAVNGTG